MEPDSLEERLEQQFALAWTPQPGEKIVTLGHSL